MCCYIYPEDLPTFISLRYKTHVPFGSQFKLLLLQEDFIDPSETGYRVREISYHLKWLSTGLRTPVWNCLFMNLSPLLNYKPFKGRDSTMVIAISPSLSSVRHGISTTQMRAYYPHPVLILVFILPFSSSAYASSSIRLYGSCWVICLFP